MLIRPLSGNLKWKASLTPPSGHHSRKQVPRRVSWTSRFQEKKGRRDSNLFQHKTLKLSPECRLIFLGPRYRYTMSILLYSRPHCYCSSSLPFWAMRAFSEIGLSPCPSTTRYVMKAPSSFPRTAQLSPNNVTPGDIHPLFATPPGLTTRVCHTSGFFSATSSAAVSERP